MFSVRHLFWPFYFIPLVWRSFLCSWFLILNSSKTLYFRTSLMEMGQTSIQKNNMHLRLGSGHIHCLMLDLVH